MERIGSDVTRELGRFGPAAGMTAIVAAWPDSVGAAISRNAWPARLARDGTLHVSTSSSAWAFELAQLAPRLLERLGEELGESAPRALRFAPGRLPEPSVENDLRPAKAAREPTPEERQLADRLAAAVGDEELRRLVARAAALSLTKAESDRSFW